MKLRSENEILNAEVRHKIIKETQSTENLRRKSKAFKGYECLKDKTDTYVLELLLAMFDPSTVTSMQYSISNISLMRKIIDKLARVYQNGVKRSLILESDTEELRALAAELDIDSAMKKLNRYLKAFKNVIAYPRPVLLNSGDMRLTLDVMPPFLYDVVEDPNCPTEPMVCIVSDYHPTRGAQYAFDPASANRNIAQPQIMNANRIGDGKEQTIADTPWEKTEKKQSYIWWSKSYHFTTDDSGEIIPNLGAADPFDVRNPIMALPFVNFAMDQDGHFWAEGGSDLVDSSIKINTLLTHLNHIAVTQGYGQLYMTGKNLPKSVKVGPNHCIQIEQNEGEPAPAVGFLSSSPPISDLKELVEANIAMLLSTNNLSTAGFSTSLAGGRDFASGVSQLIDRSESIEDINEQAQIFKDKEPYIWEILKRWYDVLKDRGVLSEDLASLPFPEDTNVLLSFVPPQPILSEMDALSILEKRKDLGLMTHLDMIMRDNPALSKEAAENKAKEITGEKMARMEAAILPMTEEPEEESEEEEDAD